MEEEVKYVRYYIISKNDKGEAQQVNVRAK